MIKRIFNDTRTPETPEKITKDDHLCKMIRLPVSIDDENADTCLDVGDLLLELKQESESILRLMDQHQSQQAF